MRLSRTRRLIGLAARWRALLLALLHLLLPLLLHFLLALLHLLLTLLLHLLLALLHLLLTLLLHLLLALLHLLLTLLPWIHRWRRLRGKWSGLRPLQLRLRRRRLRCGRLWRHALLLRANLVLPQLLTQFSPLHRRDGASLLRLQLLLPLLQHLTKFTPIGRCRRQDLWRWRRLEAIAVAPRLAARWHAQAAVGHAAPEAAPNAAC